MASLISITEIEYDRDEELWRVTIASDGLNANATINKKAMKDIMAYVFTIMGEYFAKNPDIGGQSGLIGKIVIDYRDEQDAWILDLSKKPATVEHADHDASITLTFLPEYFIPIMSGDLSGEDAFMGNKFKMNGNPTHALRLSGLIRDEIKKIRKSM